MAVKEGRIQNQRKTWLKAQAGPDEAVYFVGSREWFLPLQMLGEMTSGCIQRRFNFYWVKG